MSRENAGKIFLLNVDRRFLYELVENGFYDSMENIVKDAIRGSHRKEELKNISKEEWEKGMEIIAQSCQEYLSYLSQIDEETMRKIEKAVTGETNPYEEKLEMIEKSQEPKKDIPFFLDPIKKIELYNIDLKQRIREWREKEEYDPDFNV